MQITIGSKYQIVIPKDVRKKVKGLKPGSKVSVQAQDDNAITVKPVNQNWSDLNYGKFKNYLKGAAEEVDKMRDEWEEKLKEVDNTR